MLALILCVFVGCFLLERLAPGWRLPRVRTWAARVVLVNLVQLAVVVLAGVSWERWYSRFSVWHLSRDMTPLSGGLIAYLIATFIFYWWHRWRHEIPLLWRLFHQIHHSAQRIEVFTSFYKHPGEMIVNSIIGSLLAYALLGLSPESGAIYTACTAFGEFFYHTNVRTPRWVGYVFQRPEMHRVHHQYGRHRNNYGDLACWDMLFGTYENPETFRARCGFDDALEQRLGDMLAWRDVHADAPGRKRRRGRLRYVFAPAQRGCRKLP
jgi:sterol desaturase/sphingolipid hydroxylase (fatty acid hydroxylase superfamily)